MKKERVQLIAYSKRVIVPVTTTPITPRLEYMSKPISFQIRGIRNLLVMVHLYQMHLVRYPLILSC